MITKQDIWNILDNHHCIVTDELGQQATQALLDLIEAEPNGARIEAREVETRIDELKKLIRQDRYTNLDSYAQARIAELTKQKEQL